MDRVKVKYQSTFLTWSKMLTWFLQTMSENKFTETMSENKFTEIVSKIFYVEKLYVECTEQRGNEIYIKQKNGLYEVVLGFQPALDIFLQPLRVFTYWRLFSIKCKKCVHMCNTIVGCVQVNFLIYIQF